MTIVGALRRPSLLARQAPQPPPYGPPQSPQLPRPRYGEGLPPDLVYPWDPPGKRPGAPGVPDEAGKPRRRRPRGRIVLAVLALLLLLAAVRALIFLAAVSTEPLYTAHFWPFGGPRRANVLVMGYGGQRHEGSYLTDSMLLLHTDLGDRRTAQLSVPRDLWVQIPPGSGRYAKINSAYAYGLEQGDDGGDGPIVAGGRMATTKVGEVTGLAVDHWVTIDFQGFRALVDALGGVEVDVERGFTARYPANDDPTVNPDWIEISFAAGRQRMDGETAIRYARARYALDNEEEGTDFARQRRQQRLTAAIAAKLRSPLSWWRAPAVLDALQPALRTNLAPADMALLLLRADAGGARRIDLLGGDLLENAESTDGQAILGPRCGDYAVVERYIREQLAARP